MEREIFQRIVGEREKYRRRKRMPNPSSGGEGADTREGTGEDYVR